MVPVTCDPEGKLDRVPLDQLEEFQGNLKSLGKTEYAKLKQSIAEKGFIVPVFAWRNGSDKRKLLDGHQRIRVIRNEGWEIDGGIPIVEIAATDEKDAKEKLLAIVSRYGRVEGQGLYEFLDGTGIDLEQWAVPDLPDLDLDSWLDEFMRDPEVPQGDPDAVPEVPEEPTTKLGDLWTLGDHRVLCGDATSVDDVERLMDGKRADLLITDPPYGVSYVGKTKDALVIENDNLDENGLRELIDGAFNTALIATRPGAYWYATVPAGPLHLLFVQDWKDRGILRQIMVWVKSSMVMGHSEYHYKHEPIIYGWVPGGDRRKNPDRTRTTVWEYDKPSANREHPTMKPVELFTQMVLDSTDKNDRVFDPFLGSGTTLIAAEKTGRTCYGTEIAPQYVDVIVKRWQDYTGKEATLESDGRTFNEMGAERGVELAVV